MVVEAGGVEEDVEAIMVLLEQLRGRGRCLRSNITSAVFRNCGTRKFDMCGGSHGPTVDVSDDVKEGIWSSRDEAEHEQRCILPLKDYLLDSSIHSSGQTLEI